MLVPSPVPPNAGRVEATLERDEPVGSVGGRVVIEAPGDKQFGGGRFVLPLSLIS